MASTSASPPRVAPPPPFKFIGGDIGLDFVNTVDWTARGPVDERLPAYDDLLVWAAGAGVLSPARASRLRARAARAPAAAAAAHAMALRVRHLVRRLLESVVTGKRSHDALAEFDVLHRATQAHLTLGWPRTGAAADAAGAALEWRWAEGDDELESPLWPVVRSVALLLTSAEAAKVRICGGAECGWMYVDRSRNGLRRWCEMAVCGTRQKSRVRARKRRAGR